MTFLNPAILIGMLAAAIPILIHFLNLRKVERVEFSTLTFLKELQKSKIRRIKFKQWLLLALRILIIALLVLAFARPALKTSSFLKSTSSAKVTAVVLPDDTPSMNLLSENGSNFNLMKKRAEEILNNFTLGDRVFIIKLSDASVRKFSSLDKAKRFIKNLRLSSLNGDFYGAVRKAKSILKISADVNKEFYILSDFQRNIFSSNKIQNVKTAVTPRIYWMRLKMPETNNFSLSNFSLENKILQVGKTVSFSGTVKFNGQSSSESSVLSLFLNGKKEAQFSLNGSKSENVKLNVTLSKAGLISAMCELSEDAFEYDNRNFLCFNVPENVKTAVIKKSGSNLNFLQLALNSNVNKLIQSKVFPIEQFNSVNLLNFNVAIIVGYSQELNFQKIENFLLNGGGLIFIPAGNSTVNELNKISAGLNIPAFGTLVKGKNFADINSFGKIDFSHPLFEGMFKPGEKPKIESPEFYKYFQFKTGGKGRPIIELEDGSSFLSEFLIGRGKLLVFNTPFNLDASSFPLKGFFAPLINRALFYLSSNTGSIKSVEAGEPIEVKLTEATIPQLTVLRPDGEKEIIDLSNYGKNFYNYKRTNLIGIYRFYSGKKLIDYAAVNPVKSESGLTSLSEREIEAKIVEEFPHSQLMQIRQNSNLKELISRSRFGIELWKYFLLLALIFALVEMLFSKSSKKDLVDLKETKE